MAKGAYRIVANGWKKQTSEGKPFVSISVKEDIPRGTALFQFANEYKREGKKDSDYIYSVKNE